MRQRKIRGQRRRQKSIDRWVRDTMSFGLVNYLISERDRCDAKIEVHPWSGISLTKGAIPEPIGKTKQKMLDGLLDIYECWKTQLDTLNQPYYLKLWLFEPRFSRSQVVCAIGDSLHFYDHTFFKPEVAKSLLPANYGNLKARLEKLRWEYYLDEDDYDNSTVGEPEQYASQQDFEYTQEWFNNLLKKPHRKVVFSEPIGDITESYSFKRGDVWVGEKKCHEQF